MLYGRKDKSNEHRSLNAYLAGSDLASTFLWLEPTGHETRLFGGRWDCGQYSINGYVCRKHQIRF